MKVTGQLAEPQLHPCPCRDDIHRHVTDTCQPIVPRPVVKTNVCGGAYMNDQIDPEALWVQPSAGFVTTVMDNDRCMCCLPADQLTPGCKFDNSLTHVSLFYRSIHHGGVEPEHFKYDQYRYQMFVKPLEHELGFGSQAQERQYVPPNTDIRGLRQTNYIPIIPTKPGGETDVTYPMTPRTMGQPDVTTACCVPVIPCNPGFQNLTPCVRQDPSVICQTYNKCKQPQQLAERRVDICTELERTRAPQRGRCPPTCQQPCCAPPRPAPMQYMVPPSNRPGSGCLGLPDTFPQARQIIPDDITMPSAPAAPSAPCAPTVPLIRQNSECAVSACGDIGAFYRDHVQVTDGFNPHCGPNEAYTDIKVVRYGDRVQRASTEAVEEQCERLMYTCPMYGAYGSYLLSRPARRRFLVGVKDCIKQQGNGFSWSHPKNENRFCYILKRNTRC